MSARRIPTSRSFDFIRPERREKMFALATFFALTGFVSLFGEVLAESALLADAELLAADSGAEVALSMYQPTPWLMSGLLFTAFTLPVSYAEFASAPMGAKTVRLWAPLPLGKVPI